MGLRRALLGLFFVLVAACPGPLAPDPPPLPDAGDEAFVRRLVPVMLGRGPLALQEVEVFLQVLEQTDRETLVRALARSEEYRSRWADVLLDALAVNRIGERANPPCFGVALLSGDEGELAAWLRDHPPDGEPYPAAWTLADLVRSSSAISIGVRAPTGTPHGHSRPRRVAEKFRGTMIADTWERGYGLETDSSF